ncbi:MAG: hypothetical protein R2710_31310 [Acidimicrobiales bacterium]
MVASQFAAESGDGVTLVALPLYVFERTNSALATSLTFTAELVGGVVLGVVGGVLAGALDRRRVLMISAIRGLLLMAAFAVEPIAFAVGFGVLGEQWGRSTIRRSTLSFPARPRATYNRSWPFGG